MRLPSSGESLRSLGAVDIGGSKIAVGIIREDGQVLARSECPTLPQLGAEHALDRIENMLLKLSASKHVLHGIGVGCPGPLDPQSGTLLDIGTLIGWQGYELGDALQSRFGVPVAMENDADAATLAEHRWGSGQNSSRFIYVTISTGIGGGIVLDGVLYRGMHGAHPELGHQVLDPSGPLCYCGANGCWESLASGSALSAWMHEAAPELPAMTAQAICEQAGQGSLLALGAMKREAMYLGIGLANLATLFAPERIALGGGLMKSEKLFLPDALKMFHKLCTQVPAAATEIVLAELGTDAGLLGAAQAWLQCFR